MDKGYIISEIKRTATENNGIAFGCDRFASKTGIKNSDWEGRYWVRWSDALEEAGFAPNKFQRAHPNDLLLDKLSLFIREIGHFPIRAELKMKRHKDPTFPSYTTFDRWGGKQKLVKKVIAHCEKRDWKDIINICKSVLLDTDETSDSDKKEEGIFGEVYLGKSGRYYKIGRTNSSGRRGYELAIQLPEKIDILHVIKTDDPIGIEAYWHNRFADKRVKGEWFNLGPQDITSFKRRKFM